MASHRRRWQASEKIALNTLEEMGFRVIGHRVPVVVNGLEVGEADAIALGPNGERYVVEVKAGRVDVTGIRQAYVNALLLNGRPLVIAKGFSDESARAVASALGVRVIELSDQFVVDAEELESVVEGAVYSALAVLMDVIFNASRISDVELKVLSAVATSRDYLEASSKLGIDVEELLRRVAELKRKGVLPQSRNYAALRVASKLAILASKVMRTHELSEGGQA